MKNDYFVLAFYRFTAIEDPHREVKEHQKFFVDRDITSRIYISEEGINGQMCASYQDAHEYMVWMQEKPDFRDIHFKIHQHDEQAFPKKTVKYRKQLAALDATVDLKNQGKHLSPKEWRDMLENQVEKILIDVRNDYEWNVGRFVGAELPQCETFREFTSYADQLAKDHSVDKPVMMYCTGGIRCELYSSLLREKGFTNVFQLDGGVINYGLKEGSAHWLGKLFVFDDRLTVPISDEVTEVIGKCHFCQCPSEDYYNCANMDCNTLFLCCKECLKDHSGCCQDMCEQSPVVRPFAELNPHKPFRKKHHYIH